MSATPYNEDHPLKVTRNLNFENINAAIGGHCKLFSLPVFTYCWTLLKEQTKKRKKTDQNTLFAINEAYFFPK